MATVGTIGNTIRIHPLMIVNSHSGHTDQARFSGRHKGETPSWIENYLYEMEERMYVRGVFSKRFGVTSDVPQGSVLGLLDLCL